MILCDREIAECVRKYKMINPFISKQIKSEHVRGHPKMTPEKRRCISYGLSSYGYDLRLSSKVFEVFRHLPGQIVNPKNFNPSNLEKTPLLRDKYGDFFILPAHSYGLGVSIECFNMPANVASICLGKSTYARSAVLVNMTPIEPGFKGHLVIEISNGSAADVRVYANEGIAQVLFFQGELPTVSYVDRNGKYQNQLEEITYSKV